MITWIPVNDRLPTTDVWGISDTVACAYVIGPSETVHVGAGRFHARDKVWRVYGQNSLWEIRVLKWQPLPDAPGVTG